MNLVDNTSIYSSAILSLQSLIFFTAGHVVLRGWSQNLNTVSRKGRFPVEHNKRWCGNKMKLRHQSNHAKEALKKENKKILWFEVDDTGCGMAIETIFII
jgi:hypothetical protein